MAHAERITFAEYRSRFATEADCREYLFQIRFPEGLSARNADARNTTPSEPDTFVSAKTAGNKPL